MTSDELAFVRVLISDPDAATWSDAQIVAAGGRIAEDFTRESKSFRKKNSAWTYLAGPDQTLPADCLEVIRAVNADGRTLAIETVADIGSILLETATGDPRSLLQDEAGAQACRLWPAPQSGGSLMLRYVATSTAYTDVAQRWHRALQYGTAAECLQSSNAESDKAKIPAYLAIYGEGREKSRREAARDFRHHAPEVRYTPF